MNADLILPGLKGGAIAVLVGVVAGTAVYSQSSSLKLALVAGISAASAEALRLLVPAAAAGVQANLSPKPPTPSIR
jgi:hypothetical protein